jgi:hypothetical protein
MKVFIGERINILRPPGSFGIANHVSHGSTHRSTHRGKCCVNRVPASLYYVKGFSSLASLVPP